MNKNRKICEHCQHFVPWEGDSFGCILCIDKYIEHYIKGMIGKVWLYNDVPNECPYYLEYVLNAEQRDLLQVLPPLNEK